MKLYRLLWFPGDALVVDRCKTNAMAGGTWATRVTVRVWTEVRAGGRDRRRASRTGNRAGRVKDREKARVLNGGGSKSD